MKYFLNIIFFALVFYETNSSSQNILKFECKYDPNSIVIKQKDGNLLKNLDFNKVKICKKFNCKDEVEITVSNFVSKNKNEYRLKNLWFNHQGILLDEFSMTKKSVSINTDVSQAYYLESYLINRVNGKTKRTIYKFDYYELLEDKKKIEKQTNKKIRLFNEIGKISFDTIKLFNSKPQKKLIFEGKCLEGTGV